MSKLQAGDIVNLYSLRSDSDPKLRRGTLIGKGRLVRRVLGGNEQHARAHRPYLEGDWELWDMSTEEPFTHVFSRDADSNWVHLNDRIRSAPPSSVTPGQSFIPDWGDA